LCGLEYQGKLSSMSVLTYTRGQAILRLKSIYTICVHWETTLTSATDHILIQKLVYLYTLDHTIIQKLVYLYTLDHTIRV
jgi:hypothetical protein